MSFFFIQISHLELSAPRSFAASSFRVVYALVSPVSHLSVTDLASCDAGAREVDAEVIRSLQKSLVITREFSQGYRQELEKEKKKVGATGMHPQCPTPKSPSVIMQRKPGHHTSHTCATLPSLYVGTIRVASTMLGPAQPEYTIRIMFPS